GLERWEREHEKRKILAKDAIRVDLSSSSSDLSTAISMLKKKKKMKIVPNAAKKIEEEKAIAIEKARRALEEEETMKKRISTQSTTTTTTTKTSWLAKKIKKTQDDAREAFDESKETNEQKDEDLDEIASAIVDKVSLAASMKNDPELAKAEKAKRDVEISNALREKELAKNTSEK
ncbi:hypothetical protein, partial [Pseudomonas aeruginosa]|uniref:hypothetical protein n=1 Tax=Pseudomonas aeruginosa TaxID=287 RepID=UPI0013C4D17E